MVSIPRIISPSESVAGNSDFPEMHRPGPCPPPVASPSRMWRLRAGDTRMMKASLASSARHSGFIQPPQSSNGEQSSLIPLSDSIEQSLLLTVVPLRCCFVLSFPFDLVPIHQLNRRQ